MKVRRSLLKDVCTVETYGGEGGASPVYGPPISVRCNVRWTRRIARNADTEEAVSEAVIQIHPDKSTLFVAGSRVVIQSKTTFVQTSAPQTFRGGTVFQEVHCG